MLPTFAYADSFVARVQAMPNDAKKLVYRKVAEFCAAPGAAGFNAEALSGKARANGWHSARVDRDLRLIWGRVEDTIVFVWVDRHDDAYAWADRNRLRVHPRTGSAQRYLAPEAVPEAKREATSQPKAGPLPEAQSPPFEAERDDYLLGLGVPEEWLPRVKGLATTADLDSLIGCLPDEAWERLVDLANGQRPVPSAEKQGDDLANPLRHPDSRRRFLMLSDDADLERALSDDWETWQAFLHPSQRTAVETSHNGPSLVSGAAGTGKSVVVVHRAAWLANRHTDARILLTTYSRTLAARLSQQLDRLLSANRQARGRIEVEHLDKRLMDLARLKVGAVNIANRSHIQPTLDRAAQECRLQIRDPGFLWAEWETVVDAWGISDLDAYLGTKRDGRGLALPPEKRRQLWPIFEATIQRLERQRLRTWAAVARAVVAELERRADRPYTHVVADEVQDFSPAHLRLLKALVGDGRDTLTMAADAGQRIFRRPFSWLSAGVDVRGRATRLRVSYRSTQQILALADRVGSRESTDSGSDEARDAVAVRAGPHPQFARCTSVSEEAEAVASWIRACVADGIQPSHIAVFARTGALVQRIALRAARLAGVPAAELEDDRHPAAGSIAVGTMHRAKGLEFRAVAVVGCTDDTMPLSSVVTATRHTNDRALAEAAERHLLYVALTRPRDLLLVTWTGIGSRFLSNESRATAASSGPGHLPEA